MARKERLSREKGVQNKIEKERKKMRKNKNIQDAQKKIGGETSAFIYDKKRDDKDFEREIMTSIPEDYQRIHFGRVAVRDEDTREIVFMVQFSPFNRWELKKNANLRI